MVTQIQALQKQLKLKAEQVLTLVALNFIYLLGIGITAVVANFVGKSFLQANTNTWHKNKCSPKLQKMY
jgi:cytochrome c biogenesis protein CcdA